MPVTRLSPLDASFLAVETPTAHMHVGWVAVLEAPADRPTPTFGELQDHVAARLCRAPRCRQVLRSAPLGIGGPVWVDDQSFEIARHVVRARSRRLSDAVAWFMSKRLSRERPLWQICIADSLEDGRIAVLGKAHHCMVDGIAAVELASLIVDDGPDAPEPDPDSWVPQAAPGAPELVVRALGDFARQQLDVASMPARVGSSPARLAGGVVRARRVATALLDAARPARGSSLNPPISARRQLGLLARPTDDLLEIKRAFGVKLNDVVLAVCAGAVRELLRGRGERPIRLKSMVPVNVRGTGEAGDLGNQISFMFIDLPCDEPDPIRRLRDIHAATSDRKQSGEAEGARDVMRSLGFVPSPVQRAVSRLVASPRAFNLTVSNIPGPRGSLYVRGCPLAAAYPVVPIADRHALSIGVTTVGEGAFFGLYADPEALPEVDELGAGIARATDELLALSLPSIAHRPRVPIPA
ncbi:MAG: wax ester/triacylglycerol synthase family O-acyltransferase [Solirubrobacterales bacterium]